MYSLSYFNDVIGARAELSLGDSDSHRILYVHQGAATINGTEFPADTATYVHGSTSIKAGAEGVRIFRWDLAQGSVQAPGNIETMLRMSREIWSLDLRAGSTWLLRLDRIGHPAPGAADCHTHPGPGIRALLSGQFKIEQTSESGVAERVGDPWWETGVEVVISTPRTNEDVHFLRALLLPVEFKGRSDTAVWLRGKPKKKSEWKIYVDEEITLTAGSKK